MKQIHPRFVTTSSLACFGKCKGLQTDWGSVLIFSQEKKLFNLNGVQLHLSRVKAHNSLNFRQKCAWPFTKKVLLVATYSFYCVNTVSSENNSYHNERYYQGRWACSIMRCVWHSFHIFGFECRPTSLNKTSINAKICSSRNELNYRGKESTWSTNPILHKQQIMIERLNLDTSFFYLARKTGSAVPLKEIPVYKDDQLCQFLEARYWLLQTVLIYFLLLNILRSIFSNNIFRFWWYWTASFYFIYSRKQSEPLKEDLR